MNRFIVALIVSSCLACSSGRPPGSFADSGPFHGNTLRLQADGKFSYEAWSDDGGAFWRGEGTWQWLDRDRFATEVAKVTLGAETECGPLNRYQIWRATSRGVVRESAVFTPRRTGT